MVYNIVLFLTWTDNFSDSAKQLSAESVEDSRHFLLSNFNSFP